MNQRLKEIVLNIEKNQGKFLNMLIENKIVDLNSATAEVINTNNAQAIYYFAKYIKNADKNILAQAIIKTNDINYIIEFAYLPNIPKDILINKIVLLEDPKYIYILAKNMNNAPIEKLAQVLIRTNNSKYIYYFLICIPNAPIQLLINHLKYLGAYEYITKLIIFYDNEQVSNQAKKEKQIFTYLKEHYIELFEFMKTCTDVTIIKNCIINLNIPEHKKYFQKIYISLLSDEDKLNYLIELYNNNDILTISDNRDYFKNLFQNTEQKAKNRGI